MDWSPRPTLTRSRGVSGRPSAAAGQPARSGRTHPVGSGGANQRVRARERRARGRPRTRRGSGPVRGASGVPRGGSRQSSVGKRTVLSVQHFALTDDGFTSAVDTAPVGAAADTWRFGVFGVVRVVESVGTLMCRRVIRRHGFSSAGWCANTSPDFLLRAASRLRKSIRPEHQKDNAPEQQTQAHTHNVNARPRSNGDA